jgi:hypothetical protein
VRVLAGKDRDAGQCRTATRQLFSSTGKRTPRRQGLVKKTRRCSVGRCEERCFMRTERRRMAGRGYADSPGRGDARYTGRGSLRDVVTNLPASPGGVRRSRASVAAADAPKLGVDADGGGHCAQTHSLEIVILIGYSPSSLYLWRLHFLSERPSKVGPTALPSRHLGGRRGGPTTARCGGRVAEECPRRFPSSSAGSRMDAVPSSRTIASHARGHDDDSYWIRAQYRR